MQVVVKGHEYQLNNMCEGGAQTLNFVHKELNPETGSFDLVRDGTTNEEVLEVLIDRMKAMNEKLPCRETAIAITHLETALLWINERTRQRKLQGVENTMQKHS